MGVGAPIVRDYSAAVILLRRFIAMTASAHWD